MSVREFLTLYLVATCQIVVIEDATNVLIYSGWHAHLNYPDIDGYDVASLSIRNDGFLVIRCARHKVEY